MKKPHNITCLCAALAASTLAPAASAQGIAGVGIESASITHPGPFLAVEMALSLDELQVGTNRSVALRPVLASGDDSLALPAIGIYGHTRWLQMQRSGRQLTGDGEISMQASKAPSTLLYSQMLPYEPWMDGATLSLLREDYGCRTCRMADIDGPLRTEVASWAEPRKRTAATIDELAFAIPEAETAKVRQLSGQAYVDFAVNKADIDPDYRNNQAELLKITATIDSVRSDADATVRRVAIKGYASPEGSYANNERLARERTQALAAYVGQLYSFPAGVVHTSWEAENWQGLIAFLERSSIDAKDEILAIAADEALAPDAREQKIKARYPEQYKLLLAACYPALRVSDYTIEYELRTYTDPAEIAQVMATRPQNLSLNELYALAQTYAPGSDDFNEVFRTAVRLFPADEAANLNAANAALLIGDLATAERYLQRAGLSPGAEQARRVLAELRAD